MENKLICGKGGGKSKMRKKKYGIYINGEIDSIWWRRSHARKAKKVKMRFFNSMQEGSPHLFAEEYKPSITVKRIKE